MQINIASSACVCDNFADTLKKLIGNALSLQQLACRAICIHRNVCIGIFDNGMLICPLPEQSISNHFSRPSAVVCAFFIQFWHSEQSLCYPSMKSWSKPFNSLHLWVWITCSIVSPILACRDSLQSSAPEKQELPGKNQDALH
jgi:hypothetical protein